MKQIKTKCELVLNVCDALKRAIENQSETNIERQKTTIAKTANEIHELKVKVQEMRIHKGDDKDEIKTWSESIEGDLETVKQRRCAYCDEINHASVNCLKLATPEERKKFLSENRLCFNCTGARQRTSD